MRFPALLDATTNAFDVDVARKSIVKKRKYEALLSDILERLIELSVLHCHLRFGIFNFAFCSSEGETEKRHSSQDLFTSCRRCRLVQLLSFLNYYENNIEVDAFTDISSRYKLFDSSNNKPRRGILGLMQKQQKDVFMVLNLKSCAPSILCCHSHLPFTTLMPKRINKE